MCNHASQNHASQNHVSQNHAGQNHEAKIEELESEQYDLGCNELGLRVGFGVSRSECSRLWFHIHQPVASCQCVYQCTRVWCTRCTRVPVMVSYSLRNAKLLLVQQYQCTSVLVCHLRFHIHRLLQCKLIASLHLHYIDVLECQIWFHIHHALQCVPTTVRAKMIAP